MNAADIRDLYRDFFVERGHLAGEPASLVPAGDASVLFTTAGMQQYKPYFLGTEKPPATRITTCQRSFRTSDVENVGKTARHLTFFEMLGNFSFGDYFKTEAIQWALELSDQLGIPREKVWVSVYGGDPQVPADEEAVELWKSHGFTDDRIVRLGRSDNFWGPAGPTGPCGPCSELYYDWGPEHGCDDPDCKPGLRLRPLPRVLEPRVRAVRHGRGRPPHAAAQGQHRHRHGPRAHREHRAGRHQRVRHRPVPAARGAGCGAGRRDAGGLARRHPRPAHHGRARPGGGLPHHGRRAARQRRPRLRAAAHHPPRRAAGRGDRRREAVPGRPHRHRRRGHGRRRTRRSSPRSPRSGVWPARRRCGSAARSSRAWASSRRRCGAPATPARSCRPRWPSSCTTPTASRSTSRARSPPSRT